MLVVSYDTLCITFLLRTILHEMTVIKPDLVCVITIKDRCLVLCAINVGSFWMILAIASRNYLKCLFVCKPLLPVHM